MSQLAHLFDPTINEGSVKSEKQQYDSKSWILYAFLAMALFTVNNEILVIITNHVSFRVIYYWASGGVITGVTYNIYKC